MPFWPVLRRSKMHPKTAPLPDLEITLPCPHPAITRRAFAFLQKRLTPGVQEMDAGLYRRSFRIDGRPGLLELGFRSETTLGLRAWLSPGLEPDRVQEAVIRLLDLRVEPRVIQDALSSFYRLRPAPYQGLVVPLPVAFERFPLVLRAIIGQQISVAGATTLYGRLVEAVGTPAPFQRGGVRWLNPSPEEMLKADLRGLRLSDRKKACLLAIAESVASGRLSLADDTPKAEFEAAFLAIKGVGPWTAAYVRMRGFGDRDAFPASDLGLLRADLRSGLGADTGSHAASDAAINLEALAEAWRPYRAYAALNLWYKADPKASLGALASKASGGAAFEFEQRDPLVMLQKQAAARRFEVGRQLFSVPGAASKMHLGVRAALVGVVRPVGLGERFEIERTFAEPREVAQGRFSLGLGQVLQHALADHEVGAWARVIDDGGLLPAKTLGAIATGFDAPVLRVGQKLEQRGLPAAKATAHIEHLGDRHLQVIEVADDEARQTKRGLPIAHPGLRIAVKAVKVGLVKRIAHRLLR